MTRFTVTIGGDEIDLGTIDAETPMAAGIQAHRQWQQDNKRDPHGFTYEQHGPRWGRGTPGGINGNGAQNFDRCLFVSLDGTPVAIVQYTKPST